MAKILKCKKILKRFERLRIILEREILENQSNSYYDIATIASLQNDCFYWSLYMKGINIIWIKI